MPTYRMPVITTDPRAGRCVNVWHFRTLDPGETATSEFAAAVAAIRAFYVGIASWIAPGAAVTADFAVNVADDTDRAVTWASLAGAGTGVVAPPHISLCVGWKTAVRGRRARGRTFLPPTTLGAIDTDGTLNTTYLQNTKTAADALVNASKAANGWAIGVYGQQDSAPGASSAARAQMPHVLRDIVGYAIADKFAVLRSRRP